MDPNLATPPARRTKAEMWYACNSPTPGASLVPVPWRITLEDPIGLAFPLYELDSFDPIGGINYDGMHTIYGVMRDTVVRYVQSFRKRSAAMEEYDKKNDIITVSGRGEKEGYDKSPVWYCCGWVKALLA